MRVLVTGSTGVIGRRAVPLLIAAGHEVTAVVRGPEKAAQVERSGAAAIETSLFDGARIGRAMAGHDAVINLATHIPRSSLAMVMKRSWRENDRIRREGSAILVDAAIAAGVGRFVQESFAPVYPDRGNDWIDETVPIEPVGYSRTVRDAERSAARFAETPRGTAVVLRFAAFYGPDAAHIADLRRAIRLGYAPIPGPTGAFISSVSHDDAASAVVAALGVRAGIYNVTDDEPLSHRDYANAVADAFGLERPKLPPPWVARFMGGAGQLLSRSERISNRKFRSESEWIPRFPSARDGLRAAAKAIPS